MKKLCTIPLKIFQTPFFLIFFAVLITVIPLLKSQNPRTNRYKQKNADQQATNCRLYFFRPIKNIRFNVSCMLSIRRGHIVVRFISDITVLYGFCVIVRNGPNCGRHCQAEKYHKYHESFGFVRKFSYDMERVMAIVLKGSAFVHIKVVCVFYSAVLVCCVEKPISEHKK